MIFAPANRDSYSAYLCVPASFYYKVPALIVTDEKDRK